MFVADGCKCPSFVDALETKQKGQKPEKVQK